ncbi:golgin subfamily A member 6-like protein 6 isoform X3 [Betta splendens]|uniref:Golgin subfamily A member 6-like protein 6 isoform X3 n=1 Tax=Betta splendens TaxID=158456 RepID=A0A9W2Y7V8_BETSP|nr:golgin subfamily A member 6-like protein 6 isoform X3 [Betta splendens]
MNSRQSAVPLVIGVAASVVVLYFFKYKWSQLRNKGSKKRDPTTAEETEPEAQITGGNNHPENERAKDEDEQLEEEAKTEPKDLQNLKEELEAKNKQLHQHKMEVQSLTEKNEELEKQLTELRKNNEQQIKGKVAEVEVQLNQEQQRRWEAEKNLQNLKEELESENKQEQKESLQKRDEALEKQLSDLRDEEQRKVEPPAPEVTVTSSQHRVI